MKSQRPKKLKCPQCGQKMLYSSRGSPAGKYKRCVFCGRSFKVTEHIIG